MQRAGIATSAASLCTTESRSSVERRIVDPEERPCAARAALVRYQFDANVDQRLGDMRISSELIPRNLLVRSAVLAGTLIIVPQLAGPLPGQDRADTTAVLIGEVQSAMSGDPVINAVVFLRASQRGAITDSAGSFTLDSIPPGTDTLVIRYPGIDAQSTVMEFASQQEIRAVFLLAEKIFQVADIEVSIRAPSVDERNLERRMRTGQGVFITRERLLEVATDRPSDALRNIPRVEVTPYGLSRIEVFIGSGASACPPTYLVDGTPMDEGFVLDDIELDAIELIEIYRGPSEIPTQYRQAAATEGVRRGRCGLINIRIRSGPD
jgi:hypothetical protein